MIALPKNEGLNIIPFIDIMLVLLAIVLSISTFIAQGDIKVNLPSASSASAAHETPNKLQITINENSEFFLSGKQVDLEAIKAAILALDSRQLVELKSDKNAKFEAFIQLLDLLKSHNHENFKIITEKVQ